MDIVITDRRDSPEGLHGKQVQIKQMGTNISNNRKRKSGSFAEA